jgi:hypothetical protein
MSRLSIAAATLVVFLPTAAFAQFGTTYDPYSGNIYNYNHGIGGTNVYGTNPRTGSMWQSTIEPNGNQHGINSHGNLWNYNAGSGSYMNSNGHGCIGSGYARSCW